MTALSLAACSADDPSSPSGDVGDSGDTSSEAETETGTETGETGDEPGGETGETGGETGETGEDPGANAYCQKVTNWEQGWTDYELEVIALVNAARIEGRDCGEAGIFAPGLALTIDPALSCAARVHSHDMAERDYVDHVNPEGQDFDWRFGEAGYAGKPWAENIGAGYPVPADVVEAWLGSDIHCSKLLSPDHVDVGVGYAFGPDSTYAHYWTLGLGAPLDGGEGG